MQTINQQRPVPKPQPPDTPPCSPTFHPFPCLPPELQIAIWQEATSTPRMVQMLLHTAHDRSQAYAALHGGDADPDSPAPEHAADPDSPPPEHADDSAVHSGRLPALLHVSHRARVVGLLVYKHRFRVMGCRDDLWETYVLADHDILCLSDKDVTHLAAHCLLRNPEQPDRSLFDDFNDFDHRVMSRLDCAAKTGNLSCRKFRTLATRRIKSLMDVDDGAAAPYTRGVRGDFGPIKQLIVYGTTTEDRWPGLLRDADVLARFDCGFARVPGEEAPDLPARYRCRPVYCPHHPCACDWTSFTMAVCATRLSLPQLLTRCAVGHGSWITSDPLKLAFARGYATTPWRWATMWRFDDAGFVGEGRRARGTAPRSLSERRADRFRSLACQPLIGLTLDVDERWNGTCRRQVPPGSSWTYNEMSQPYNLTPDCNGCLKWWGHSAVDETIGRGRWGRWGHWGRWKCWRGLSSNMTAFGLNRRWFRVGGGKKREDL